MGREWPWSSRRSERRVLQGQPAGCLTGMLQMLEFHKRLRCMHSYQTHSPPTTPLNSPVNHNQRPRPALLNGLEATRKKENDCRIKAPFTSNVRGTACPNSTKKDVSEVETPRTPSVVARLMGLDMLPSDHCEPPPPPPSKPPRHDQRKKEGKKNQQRSGTFSARESSPPFSRRPLRVLDSNIPLSLDLRYEEWIGAGASRSLPDTPRSSSARRSCDAERRLSFQLDSYEEAMRMEFDNLCDVASMSSTKSRGQKEEWKRRRRSPGHCAREIMEKAKESITQRKTTTEGSDHHDLTFCTKPKTITRTHDRRPEPRQQSHEIPSNTRETTNKNTKPYNLKYNERCIDPQRIERCNKPSPPMAGKAISVPPFSLHATPPPKPSSRPTPELRKVPVPVHSTLTSSSPRQTAQEPLKIPKFSPLAWPTAETKKARSRWFSSGSPEWQYVKSILQQAGVRSSRSITTARWHTPSHPINPTIFHKLELSMPGDVKQVEVSKQGPWRRELGHMKHRCNRKLVFNLVDELLVDILRPCLNTKPWLSLLHVSSGCSLRMMSGSLLLRLLWSKIRQYCGYGEGNVEEVVHYAVCGGLPEVEVPRLMDNPMVGEEVERMLFELEEDILQAIVVEIVDSVLEFEF